MQSRTPGSKITEVFLVFLRLGLTSFGGPIAHIGYFREELVARRKWLDERTYADLVALCQFLPGPASSQIGMAAGLLRAGYAGALAAWTAFTLPSAIALTLFAFGMPMLGSVAGGGWLHGLKIAAVAVVGQAVLAMLRSLAPDRERATLAGAAAIVVLAIPAAWGQVSAIALGAAVGLFLLRGKAGSAGGEHGAMPVPVGRAAGVIALLVFFALLAGLPLLAAATDSKAVALIDSFYRAGSLVFGGGHVVLPLLQAEVAPRGWVTNDQFLAGYGAAQAVPGPLFTFAAYLGAVIGGWGTAALCLAAVFAPSFLLVFGAMPFWEQLRRKEQAQAALLGVNAAVAGLLLAALYHPVWTAGIRSPADFSVGVAAFVALHMWKAPPWLVVALCALAGGVLATPSAPAGP